MLTPDFSPTSAMKVTSRPISIGQGSTIDWRPRSFSGLSVSTQFFSALLRSNFGIEQSSSHPAHPINRCSCIRVVPSFSGATVPVTVLICFMVRLLGDRDPKLVPHHGRRQTVPNVLPPLFGGSGPARFM